MPLYSQVTYTGNGSTVAYAIPFSYIDSTHIKAFLNGTITSAFTVSTSTLTFTTAPANGVTIRIERQTPIDARLVEPYFACSIEQYNSWSDSANSNSNEGFRSCCSYYREEFIEKLHQLTGATVMASATPTGSSKWEEIGN